MLKNTKDKIGLLLSVLASSNLVDDYDLVVVYYVFRFFGCLSATFGGYSPVRTTGEFGITTKYVA